MKKRKFLKYTYILLGVIVFMICLVFIRHYYICNNTRALTGMFVRSTSDRTYVIEDGILTELDINNVKIYDNNKVMIDKTNLKSGDIVTVNYKGLVLESNPQQIPEMHNIILIRTGQIEDISPYKSLLTQYNINLK